MKTVGEVIEELQKFDPKLPAYVEYEGSYVEIDSIYFKPDPTRLVAWRSQNQAAGVVIE